MQTNGSFTGSVPFSKADTSTNNREISSDINVCVEGSSIQRAELELSEEHGDTGSFWVQQKNTPELTCYILSRLGGRPCPFPVGTRPLSKLSREDKDHTTHHCCQHTYVQRGLVVNNGQLHDVWIDRLQKKSRAGQITSKQGRHLIFYKGQVW